MSETTTQLQTLTCANLEPFVLGNARFTGRTIGSGSYGTVEEVSIPGATCAAKKIHQFLQDRANISQEGLRKVSREFVVECKLMSTLRHPHIVQFLGVCFCPNSNIPALVMEKLLSSLHDVLDPEELYATKARIPLSLKNSIMHNVASGLAFLHSHTPAIIHRDLSAKNVLLTEGMVAKIADLGVARIVPSLRAVTMTQAPGTSVYMPPEALEDESRYDVTIDVFSFGVLALFVLSQVFPKPLAAAYMDDDGVMVGYTELERRGHCMQIVLKRLSKDHPLVQMIEFCLKNRTSERPTIVQVLEMLEQASAQIDDERYDVSKLALVQTVIWKEETLQSKDEHIELQRQQNNIQKEQIEIQQQRIESLQEENAVLKQALKIALSSSKSPLPKTNPVTSVQPSNTPPSLHWRKGQDTPCKELWCALSTTVDGKVFFGGNNNSHIIVQYDPENGKWSELPRPLTPDTSGSALTSLNGQLVLVGGGEDKDKVTVWDSSSEVWFHPYPPMPHKRSLSAAVGYQHHLMVACGYPWKQCIDILDSSSGRWHHSSQQVPLGSCLLSTAVVDDCWYVSSLGCWEDRDLHIFWVHLPTLTTDTGSTRSRPTSLWHELPKPPVPNPTLVAYQSKLLLVGSKGCTQEIYYYNREKMQWKVFGKLPERLFAPGCAVLPSGDLMVAGGKTDGEFSQKTWIGRFE